MSTVEPKKTKKEQLRRRLGGETSFFSKKLAGSSVGTEVTYIPSDSGDSVPNGTSVVLKTERNSTFFLANSVGKNGNPDSDSVLGCRTEIPGTVILY